MAPVTASISRMPGPPFGPSLRITTTSPGRICLPRTAAMASSSDSKTRAGPRWVRRSWPEILATHPSGAILPFKMTKPPVSFSGFSRGTITSWEGVSIAASLSADTLRPVTVSALAWRCPPRRSRRASRRTPPALCISAATNRPAGFKSASKGVRSLTF